MIFKDRFDAAYRLAERLKDYKDNKDAILLAIPRGSLEIGYILARELNLPLDIIFTKKIGAPGNPEFAIGVVSMENYFVEPEYEFLEEYIKNEVDKIQKILKERYQLYRSNKNPINLDNKIVILIDDGIATGKTILSAIELIRKQNPKKIVVAVPVAPIDTINLVKKKVDELICLYIPKIFYGVGQFYNKFDQVEDEQAIEYLNEANK